MPRGKLIFTFLLFCREKKPNGIVLLVENGRKTTSIWHNMFYIIGLTCPVVISYNNLRTCKYHVWLMKIASVRFGCECKTVHEFTAETFQCYRNVNYYRDFCSILILRIVYRVRAMEEKHRVRQWISAKKIILIRQI